jgi:hypothetical protein
MPGLRLGSNAYGRARAVGKYIENSDAADAEANQVANRILQETGDNGPSGERTRPEGRARTGRPEVRTAALVDG